MWGLRCAQIPALNDGRFVSFVEPKKCEDVQVCKKSSKDKLECEQKKECKDFERTCKENGVPC